MKQNNSTELLAYSFPHIHWNNQNWSNVASYILRSFCIIILYGYARLPQLGVDNACCAVGRSCAPSVGFCKNRQHIGQKPLRHFLSYVGYFSEICGQDTFKLKVTLFCCFLGHRLNPNLTDWRPDNIDFHDFRICGTPMGTLICGFECIKLLYLVWENIPNHFWKRLFLKVQFEKFKM